MSCRDSELEKSTRTDLLYGLAAEAAPLAERESDVAVLERDEDCTQSTGPVRNESDVLRQHAATRVDLAMAQLMAAHSGESLGRWRYADGIAPAKLPEIVPSPQRRSLRQSIKTLLRGSVAFAASFFVHLALLPALALLNSSLDSAPRFATLVTHAPPEERLSEMEPLPVTAELPADYFRDPTPPNTLEIAIPEPRFERGAMPRLTAEQVDALLNIQAAAGPVSDVQAMLASEGRGKAQSGTGSGGASFFGTEASGNKFVFVVDCSISMLEKNRWNEATIELCAAIERLRQDQLFYVILFDGAPHRMFNHEERQIAMYPATFENKQKFYSWLSTAQLGYNTRPFLAMKNALELQPDAIFLLSDGEFTKDDNTVKLLKDVNRGFDKHGDPCHACVVHTFNFHNREGASTLRLIANQNRGHYTFIKSK